MSTAGAQTQTFFARLSGLNEAPPTTSTGTGFASFTLQDNRFLTLNVTFSGLTGNTTASHIHCCVPPDPAGVATQVPTFTGFPLGVTAGTYSNTFDLTLASSWNPAFITASGGTITGATSRLIAGMNSGTAYLNIHSSVFGGGEIRGTIVVTPEPATWALMATGLMAVGMFARRRRT